MVVGWWQGGWLAPSPCFAAIAASSSLQHLSMRRTVAVVGRPHEMSSDNSRAPYPYSSLETTHAAAIFRGLVSDLYARGT